MQKFDNLVERKDVNMIQSVRESYFDESYEFTARQGLNVAAAIHSRQGLKFDKSYGSIVFKRIEFKLDADGNRVRNSGYMDTHTCSRQELGLTEEPEARFMAIDKKSIKYVQDNQDGFVCIGDEDLRIKGDFDSVTKHLFAIEV